MESCINDSDLGARVGDFNFYSEWHQRNLIAVTTHKELNKYIRNPSIEVSQKSNDINQAPVVNEITAQIIEKRRVCPITNLSYAFFGNQKYTA